jgi:beta-galactosidase
MASYPVRIGSQLFTNYGDTPTEVRAWVRQMHASHLNLIRVFIFWEQVQPGREQWDFSLYDAIFEEAEKLGMQVVPTLTANAPPPWLKPALSIPNPRDLDDPAVWKLSLAYVRQVAKRYAKSAALDSWLLWNEPGYQAAASEFGEKAYASFLKSTYGQVDSINREYHAAYRSFEEAAHAEFAPASAAPFAPYPQRLDQMRFAVAGLIDKLKDIAAQIRQVDPNHLLHVNPHNVGQCNLPSGQSFWDEAHVVDFLGCSAHPSWHSTRFPPGRLHQSVAFFADLMKGSTLHKDGLFWVTELQGGTNIFSGVNYLCPTSDELSAWIWESIGSGAKAVVFWCFNARKGGFEGGEWGLVNQQNQVGPRLQAAEEAARLLEQYADLFASARPPRPDVWILHSENSAALGMIEGSGVSDPANPRNPQMASDALCGAYLLCSDLGLNVRFLSEEQLARSEFAEGSLLLLPGDTALEPDTCRAVADFVRRGGVLIADGLVGYKDKNGQISLENRMATNQVFGATLVDIEAAHGIDIRLENSQDSLPGWFLKCSLAESGPAQVLGRFANNAPAVVRNSFGRGVAVRIGTVFFQRYFSQPNPVQLEFFRGLLPEMPREVLLQNVSPALRLRRLVTDGADLIILINTGGPQTALLRFARTGRLKGLNNGIERNYVPGASITVPLPAAGTYVFMAAPDGASV